MLNFLPQILIFLSLSVIIVIIGKKIPQLRELKNSKADDKMSEKLGEPGLSRFFKMIFSQIRSAFVFVAEWIVKKAKKILHLVHFWLIKIKRGKTGDEQTCEIEAKQELIKEEERNLERVINEDLGRAENLPRQSHLFEHIDHSSFLLTESKQALAPDSADVSDVKISQPENNKTDVQLKQGLQRDEKIEEFFTESETEQFNDQVDSPSTDKKVGFFRRLFKRTSNTDLIESPYPSEQEEQKNLLISDQIQYPTPKTDQEKASGHLIKEVFNVNKNAEKYSDDDLGVDRKILEKKIIQKIAINPKDIENYRQLGELYIKMKNFSDAEESYKQILKTTPRDVDAKRKLEKIKLLKRLG